MELGVPVIEGQDVVVDAGDGSNQGVLLQIQHIKFQELHALKAGRTHVSLARIAAGCSMILILHGGTWSCWCHQGIKVWNSWLMSKPGPCLHIAHMSPHSTQRTTHAYQIQENTVHVALQIAQARGVVMIVGQAA